MEIVRPGLSHLESYQEVLQRMEVLDGKFFGDKVKQLDEIAKDPQAFVDSLNDPQALRGDVELEDGTFVPRIPSITWWIWDGEVSGRVQLRWQDDTTDLPPHCFGHIGYGVVPWKRQLGYATEALKQVLLEAKFLSLPFVDVNTDLDNLYSQKVIINNGGILQGTVAMPQSTGGGNQLKYRIFL